MNTRSKRLRNKGSCRAAAVVWPIMRKTNAKYDCSTETVSELSGDNMLNLRLLGRPAGFGAVPQP